MKKTSILNGFSHLVAIMLLMVLSVATAFADKGWQLVTSTSSLSVGDSIIIAAANYNVAISRTQNNNNRGEAVISKSGDLANLVGDVQIFVLQAGNTAGTFAFYDNDNNGGYLHAPGGGNYLRTTSTLPTNGAGDWVINCTETATYITSQHITAEQIYMRYNLNNTLFSCYKSSSSVVEPVAIYKYTELAPTSISAPTFSLAAGTYFTPQQVSIACSTAGSTIYYTTDGSNPILNGTTYTTPLTISTTTTVRAVAIHGSDTSSIASVLYNFPIEVANIAAFKAASSYTNNTPYRITGDVTFVFKGSASSTEYTYVKDATGGLLIFEYANSALITNTYTEGDVISGGICGTYSLYNSQVEFKPLTAPAVSTSNSGTVNPTIITIADLKANYADYDAQLIKLQNVTFPNGFTSDSSSITISQGSEVMTLYNRFNIDTTIAAGTTCDITGFAAIYNTNVQIFPRRNSDIGTAVAPTPQPSISILAPTTGSTFSTLDTLPVSLNIQNFVLGTDGLLKIESGILPLVSLPNPSYLDAAAWAAFQNMVLSPLPAGTFTATVSLVDMNQQALSTPVSATTNFTVVAPVLGTPVISFSGNNPTDAADTYYFNADVTISAEPGSTVHYTTDGTTPSEASATYTTPFTVSTTTIIKAIATMVNYANSEVATKTVTIDTPTVAAPVIAPTAGTYADSVSVTLTCTTPGASIYYTTDNTEPTTASNLYSTPFVLTTNTTVKAKAFKADWYASPVATANYTIAHEAALAVSETSLNFNSTTLTQSFDVTSAFLTSPITLTCNNSHFTLSQNSIPVGTSSATILVTYDAAEPADAIITLSSDTLSAQVALHATAKLPAPTILPADGTSDTLIIVTMACAQAGAAIQYTMNNAAVQVYSAPIVLNTPGTYTFTATASMANWENSESTSATFTVVSPAIEHPDSIIYTTGFEAAEGFVATTNYQNASPLYSGPNNQQWASIYGTPSTTSAISGSNTQSMQMRWYSNEASTLGSAYMNFDLRNVTYLTFDAKNNGSGNLSGLNVAVSYSTDGGFSYTGDTIFSVSSNTNNFRYDVSETGAFDYVRIKFAVALPDNTPANSSRLLIDNVEIHGLLGIVSNTVEAPVITPNTGDYVTAQTVSMTCATEDATIYYTLDGTIPTENSTLYTAPFTVNASTTIMAKAFKTGMNASNVASSVLTFPQEVANIAAFKAANTATNSDVYKITGDVTFVFHNGFYTFVEDATGALMIYDNNGTISTTYNEGDVISGGLYGSYTLYNGMVEMIPAANTAASTSSVTVTPQVVTIPDLCNNYSTYESKLVRINNVTFIDATTFVNGTDTLSFFNRFNTVTVNPNGMTADVIGFVSKYNNDIQLYPRGNDDIIEILAEQVETPVITVEPLTNNMYAVELTCATENAVIYYTIDGTTPDENANLYTGTFTAEGGNTIKAIATKEGWSNSEVAVYENVNINDYADANISVYPNPTNGELKIENKELRIENVWVYDVFGKLLETMSGDVQSINMSNYPSGTYFLRISTDKGMIVKKAVRQ